MSVNRAVICGNLTRDPEAKQTAGGTPVTTFSVAVNERRRNQQTDEWEDVPSFFDCVMFGERGPKVAQYIGKGSKVTVEGRLRQRSWEAQDGSRRSKVEIVADEIEFMSRREPDQAGAAPSPYAPARPAQASPYQPASPRPQAPQPPRRQAPQAQQTMAFADEDIPF